MRFIFLTKRKAVKRLDALRERFNRRADDIDDSFLRKLFYNAGNCAGIDAIELFDEIAKSAGPSAYGVIGRGFAALAYHHSRKFCLEHIDKIDAKEARISIERLFGDICGLDIDFGDSLCVENISNNTRTYIDEFLYNSYNGFVETLECVIPLESASLIGQLKNY